MWRDAPLNAARCVFVACWIADALADQAPYPPSASWRASHVGCEWFNEADPATALREFRETLGPSLRAETADERALRRRTLHRRVTACGGAERARPDWALWPWSRSWVLGSLAADLQTQVRHDTVWAKRMEAACDRGEPAACVALARLPNEVVPAPWLVQRPSVMSSATRATEAALATFTDRVAACTTAALNVAALARPKVDAALKVCDATVSAEAALQLDLADLPASVVGEQARQAVSLLHASIRRVDERSTFLRWLDACVSHGGLDACEQASLLTSVASQEESDQLQRTGSTLERLRTEADAEAARRSARALAAAAGVATACRQAKGEATTASMPTSRQREKAVEDVATYAPEALPSVLRDMEAACDSR